MHTTKERRWRFPSVVNEPTDRPSDRKEANNFSLISLSIGCWLWLLVRSINLG